MRRRGFVSVSKIAQLSASRRNISVKIECGVGETVELAGGGRGGGVLLSTSARHSKAMGYISRLRAEGTHYARLFREVGR